MKLPIQPPLPPMEAKRVDKIPTGDTWQFEPKWDGFRAIVFRDGDEVQLQSKAGQPLARYFPELVEAFRTLEPQQFVLDGEIVVPVGGRLSFDDLLQRIHPAEKRIRKLAESTPAHYYAFDILFANGKLLVDEELPVRDEDVERVVVRRSRLRQLPDPFLRRMDALQEIVERQPPAHRHNDLAVEHELLRLE